MAREIDTYEISKGPEVCCLLGPKHPATSSSKEIIEKEEEKIDVKNLIEESLKIAEKLSPQILDDAKILK